MAQRSQGDATPGHSASNSKRTAFGVATLAVILFQAAWLWLGVGGLEGLRVFDNIAMFLASAWAGVACLVPMRRAQGRIRTAWALLSASCFSWAFGQATWTFYELVLRTPSPYPSWADAGYLAMIPFAAAAFPRFYRRTDGTHHRAVAWLDGLVVGVGLVLLEWDFLLRDIYQATSDQPLAQALSLAYPLGDLVLVVLAVHFVPRTPKIERGGVILIATGLGALSIAHLAYARLILEGTYYTGHLIDIGWFAGFLLIAYGAVRAPMGLTTPLDATHISRLGRVVAGYLPLLLVAIALGRPLVRGRPLDRFEFATALLLGVLIFTRQALVIRENLALQAQLVQAKQAVEQTLHERTRLVHGVAHDLSGALSPIQLQLHLIDKTSNATEGANPQSVAIMRRSARHLKHLVGDLTELARIGQGRFELAPRPIDLAHVAQEVVDSFTPQAAERKIRLDAGLSTPLPLVADPERLTQVLYNLVRNALKFTPEGGTVRVHAAPTAAGAELHVVDTGPGLSRSQIDRLFQPFVQVHDPAKVAERGTGLGLYISRLIVEAHGGHIWCTSPGRDLGTTFTLVLPRQPMPSSVTASRAPVLTPVAEG